MNESSLFEPFSKSTLNSCGVDIQMELVSEEEMASTEAALAAATATFSSSAATTPATRSPSQFRRKARSIHSITSPPSKAKRRLSFCAESDIEDLGSLSSAQKKIRVAESFFQRFRSKTGLYVSDVTSTEWCEKQKEYVLRGQKRETDAMRTGRARHAILEEEEWCEKQMEFVLLFQERETDGMRRGRTRHAILEEEVVKKVEIQVRSVEDVWAVRLMNFVIHANQLLFEGLTRELPLIGFVEGIWMVGIIDEVRMHLTETDRNAILVETKTRVRDTPPAEPQQRNGRLQLMCYKYLWDNLVADNFPSTQFFNFFSLNPYYILSEEIWKNNTKSGFPAKTLDEVVRHFRHTCSYAAPCSRPAVIENYFLMGGGKIVDYHGCDFFPERWFGRVVVLQTDNSVLCDCLNRRGYTGWKLTDNIECEIFRVLLQEAKESYPEDIVVALKSGTIEDIARTVESVTDWVRSWHPASKS